MKKITSKLLIFLLAIIVISTPTITRIHATISHPTSVGVYSKEILYPYDNLSNTCRYNMTWDEVVNATGYQVYYKNGNGTTAYSNWVSVVCYQE